MIKSRLYKLLCYKWKKCVNQCWHFEELTTSWWRCKWCPLPMMFETGSAYRKTIEKLKVKRGPNWF